MTTHRLRKNRVSLFSRNPLKINRKIRDYTSPVWLFGYIFSRNVLLATAIVLTLIVMNNGAGTVVNQVVNWIRGGFQ